MPKFWLVGTSPPVQHELEQGFNTVGRNPTNDLRVRDATVSSFHCEIVLDQDSVRVRDLSSSNGTFVDGRPVEESALAPGSVLRLGNVSLSLERREETENVRISVPSLPTETAPVAVSLPDGHPACLHHSDTHAVFQCRACRKCFCQECVRVLRLKRSETRTFCPDCSGVCDDLPVPPEIAAALPKKTPSILGRLSQTIRIRHK